MVSKRCIIRVREVIESIGLNIVEIDLGNIEIAEQLTSEQKSYIATKLLASGLQLREDQDYVMLDSARHWIIDTIANTEEDDDKHLISMMGDALHCSRRQLAQLFARYLNTTMQHYIISQRIERAKYLLQVEDMSLTNIAYKLNYSSVAHLSYQFKKITGMTPTFFKEQGQLQQRLLRAA